MKRPTVAILDAIIWMVAVVALLIFLFWPSHIYAESHGLAVPPDIEGGESERVPTDEIEGIILLWTIWTFIATAPPSMEAIEQLCKATHPEGEITFSWERVVWAGRMYKAGMIICARPRSESTELEPEEKLLRQYEGFMT